MARTPAEKGAERMSSRNTILNKLRAAQQPFTDIPTVTERRAMVPLTDTSPEGLYARFVQEAKGIGCRLYEPTSLSDAIEQLLGIIGTDKTVSAWERQHIPLENLDAALTSAGIRIAAPDDSGVRVGITGADAGLAGTGSVVLISGAGKYRQVSLLPELHVAVMRADAIMAGMEDWIAQQRITGLDEFRRAANIVIVTGPSKTADIAQELILGAHGPKEIHIILIR
jgi:L-lactate utilization protein LutC